MCIGGGGGDPKDPKESKAKLALAQQSAIELKRYGEVFVPLENMYIEEAIAGFDENNYQQPMADASNRVQAMYEQGRSDAAQAGFGRGFDPGSGAFKKESAALASAQARGMGLSGADAGIATTDQGFNRLQNVVRMGQGLATESMGGMIDVAQTGSDRARQAAQRDFMESSSLRQLAGTGVGMATGYGLNKGYV